MTSLLKKTAIGAALAASTMVAISPAEARDRYRRGNDGAAIALGVLSIAAFAALASSDRNRYYYRDGYYYPRQRYYYPRQRYYYRSYPRQYYGYGYNGYYGSPYRNRYYYRGW